MVTVNNVSMIHFYVNYHIYFTKFLSPFKSLTIILKNKTTKYNSRLRKTQIFQSTIYVYLNSYR